MSAVAYHHRRKPAPPVSRRARIEAAVESLLALLDAMDPDPDLEDGADTEPNCGGYGASATTDECEAEDEGDELDHGERDEAEMIERWRGLA